MQVYISITIQKQFKIKVVDDPCKTEITKPLTFSKIDHRQVAKDKKTNMRYIQKN